MPHDHHDHDHDHHGLSPSGHPYRQDDDAPLTYWQRMEIAVRELLIEKGVTTAADALSCVHCHAAVGHGERAALGGGDRGLEQELERARRALGPWLDAHPTASTEEP